MLVLSSLPPPAILQSAASVGLAVVEASTKKKANPQHVSTVLNLLSRHQVRIFTGTTDMLRVTPTTFLLLRSCAIIHEHSPNAISAHPDVLVNTAPFLLLEVEHL